MMHPLRRLALLWLATLAPAVLIAILIAKNAVDMPYMDDWGLSSNTLILARTGRLGWESLIAQHNETRPFFPRLLFLALGTLSHGDVRWQLWFNFGLACAVSYCVFRLAGKTVTTAPWPLLGLTFLANLLIFTPKQAETWLWSTYVGLEPIACLVAALALLLSDLGGRSKLALAGALCTVATFSYANGLSTWLVAAPLVALVLGWRALAWWVPALTLNTVVYFHGYIKPGHHPPLVEGLQPVRLAHYLLAFFGSPWEMDRLAAATAVGAFLLVCFASTVVYLLVHRRREGLCRRMLPWLAIGCYTLASGLMSGIGRLAWGVEMALLTRYVAFTLYLAIACVFLIPIVVSDMREAGRIGPRARRIVQGLLAIAIATGLLLQASATIAGVRAMTLEGRMFRYAKSCLLLINVHPDEECLSTRVYPDTEVLRAMANELDRLGLLHPPLARGHRLQDLRAYGLTVRSAGVFETFSRVNLKYVAAGWAASPTQRRPADAVILALEGSGGDWLPFRIEPVIKPRSDVARDQGPEYARSGWRRDVRRHELPPSPFRISAWAFDAETAQVAPLEGTYLVEADDTQR